MHIGGATHAAPNFLGAWCLAHVLYTNSIKNVFSNKVAYKVYADDTKLYARTNDDQGAIDDFYFF